jgi:two-component system cell cycle response regulator
MIPKILSVDDSSLVRKAVARVFSRFECIVIEAENGQVGLEQTAAERPDLIILDYNMPVMDGVEMLKHLRSDETLKKTKVIMLTANSNPETVATVAKLGVRDYVTKPFTDDQLLAKAARQVTLVPKAAE